jgi:hypothetical protein
LRDKRAFLRIKLKSLAAEAKIIRLEEARNKRLRYELSAHRRGVVRTAARNTLLAYAFLKGRTYKSVEPNAHTPPNWKEVERMVRQYGVAGPDFTTNVNWDEYQAKKTEHEKALVEQMERFKGWPEAG